MTTATRLLPDQLRIDIIATLARLRTARMVGDQQESVVSERRLNWLLSKIKETENR